MEKEAEITADIAEVTNIAVEKKSPQAPGGKTFGRREGRGPRRRDRDEEKKEFEERVVVVDRVTRVVKGGRRMRFRALVVIGDRKGRVGYASGKGNEVAAAVGKAVNKAKKDLVKVDVRTGTVSHDIIGKSRTTRVLLKSAKKGTGIIAGGAVRIVLELAGYNNIVAKSFGSNNKTNNVIATIDGLKSLLKRKSKIDNIKEEKKSQKDSSDKEKKEIKS
uniref:Small ribosomal subunit protein uS5 n=1 Tax=candidate division CPR3 bacterium TaxID=2268181 RepID=A0A7C4M615_UNCC3